MMIIQSVLLGKIGLFDRKSDGEFSYGYEPRPLGPTKSLSSLSLSSLLLSSPPPVDINALQAKKAATLLAMILRAAGSDPAHSCATQSTRRFTWWWWWWWWWWWCWWRIATTLTHYPRWLRAGTSRCRPVLHKNNNCATETQSRAPPFVRSFVRCCCYIRPSRTHARARMTHDAWRMTHDAWRMRREWIVCVVLE